MEVKTEADADCMILEYPHDDKLAVGKLLHSFILQFCLSVVFFLFCVL